MKRLGAEFKFIETQTSIVTTTVILNSNGRHDCAFDGFLFDLQCHVTTWKVTSLNVQNS